MALIDKITALAAARGKTVVVRNPLNSNLVLSDDSDGHGPYITAWSIAELGSVPILADGFTADELKNRDKIITALPATQAQTEDETRDDALLADADRQAIYSAIRTATPAQIKNYIQNNVTDLASARAMLTRLTLLIAMIIRR